MTRNSRCSLVLAVVDADSIICIVVELHSGVLNGKGKAAHENGARPETRHMEPTEIV